MIESWWSKVRRFLANPVPVRRESSVAAWWEWCGRTYWLRRKPCGQREPQAPVTGRSGDAS